MAAHDVDTKALFDRAKQQEMEYDWRGATDTYDKIRTAGRALSPAEEGELLERTAYAASRHAFQASSNKEFLERLHNSIEMYGEAIETFEKVTNQTSSARMIRCRAMHSYLRFWEEVEVPKKKELARAAWDSTKDALEAFSRIGAHLELAKTYNDLSVNADLAWNLDESPQKRGDMLRDLERYGREVTNSLDEASNPDDLARSLVNLASVLEALSLCIPRSAKESGAILEEARRYLERAERLSERVAFLEEINSYLLVGLLYSISEERDATQPEIWLAGAKASGDLLLKGMANSFATARIDWIGAGNEVPEESKRLLDIALDHSKETRRNFACLRFVAPDFNWLPWPSAPNTPWYYWRLGRMELDPRRKREHARKTLDESKELVKFSETTGYPAARGSAVYVLGLSLTTLAKTEDDDARKKAMLQEAVDCFRDSIDASGRYYPNHTWDIGIALCNCGETEQELAVITKEYQDKMALLKSSEEHLSEGLRLMTPFHTVVMGCESVDPSIHQGLGIYWSVLGRTLRMKAAVLKDRGVLKSAIEAFEKAGEEWTTGARETRAAESMWEAAKIHGLLEDYMKASERFERAGTHYANAARKIKSFSEYFEGYASYMKAWSEIEKARYHHSKQEPAKASDHYRRAAELHSETKKWGYLTGNYMALAEVERAEELSQKEESASSRQSFSEATRLFEESRKTLNSWLGKLEAHDEKEAVSGLIAAAETRADFCRARYLLEEARILDKQGRESEAVEKYAQVEEKLRQIQKRSTSEQDKKEIGLILILVEAWKTMSLAEAETSPDLYAEAARLFEEAKNSSPGERARNLTLGHSRFCKALEAGTRFADSGDPALHKVAANNLESAVRYYVKAGFDNAAEYTRASRLLFDAYFQMDIAGKETNHEEKAKAYAVAEKLLENSAVSYDKAGHSGRKEQVLRLLERAREDRRLSISLTQVLRAPEEVGATVAFSSPTPALETAVGLDRFEHADIQATMIVKPRDMHIGEDLRLDIELVNAGRGPAQLTKVDGLIPPGFDVQTVPDKYRVEDSYLNMRGRRLSAMKTEDVKIVLRPTAQGTYVLKPRVLYLDESGKYKSFEPEPVSVTVKELGISGWLRGPDGRK